MNAPLLNKGRRHITQAQLNKLLEFDNETVGLREPLQRFIESHRPAARERKRQAKIYWRLGLGRLLGSATFEAYLASIPDRPVGLPFWQFPDDRIICDERFSTANLCQAAGIQLDRTTAKLIDRKGVACAETGARPCSWLTCNIEVWLTRADNREVAMQGNTRHLPASLDEGIRWWLLRAYQPTNEVEHVRIVHPDERIWTRLEYDCSSALRTVKTIVSPGACAPLFIYF